MKHLRITCFKPRNDNDDWYLIPTIRLTTSGAWTNDNDGVLHRAEYSCNFRILFLKFVWTFLMFHYYTKWYKVLPF